MRIQAPEVSRIRRRAGIVLRSVFILLALVLPVTEGLASMRADHSKIIGQLDSENVVWDAAQLMFIGGVATHIVPFTSSHSAGHVAQAFSDTSSVFDRVLTMPGQLILSGMKDNWHWLAVVSADSSGARGYVSTMHAEPTKPATAYSWLPQHAPALFSHHDVAGGRSVVQQVYRFEKSLPALQAHVDEQLAGRGWKPSEKPVNTAGPWHWGRSDEHLFMMAIAEENGTKLFIQHITRGAAQ